jgi:hypothetical protein
LHARTHELKQIFVVGREYHFHSGSFARSNGIAPHQVVGLGIRKGDISEAQQGGELLDKLELRDHRFGHFFARFFVSRLQLYSLLRQAFVPYHRAQFRLQMFHH